MKKQKEERLKLQEERMKLKEEREKEQNTPVTMNSNTYQNLRQVVDHTQYIQEKEQENINDPLRPPLKREPYRLPINIKTRGDGGPYQQMGTLFKKTNTDQTFGAPGNNDKNIILSLYGKPTYTGSRLYNYYQFQKKV